MARVEGKDIKEIMDTDYTANQLEPFVKIANIVVDDKLGSSDLSAAQLREIERWLAAHFAQSTKGVIKSEKLGDATITYESAVNASSKGLDTTPYGKQVKILDTTGILANMGKKKVNFEVVN